MVGQWGDIEATILREGTVQIHAPYMKMKYLKQISLFDFRIQKKCEKIVIGKRRFCERIVRKMRIFSSYYKNIYDRTIFRVVYKFSVVCSHKNCSICYILIGIIYNNV